ncbi:hypothetical protein [Kribbella sp. ALI-6-A]|uniref:hypothetical protein n=1 Tax=Kribbella sp. ALI-6-A TaxID=1933817 RepID=UPI00143DC703|nr:hypothetical protein [Kribbella sp. ALI-6-A]
MGGVEAYGGRGEYAGDGSAYGVRAAGFAWGVRDDRGIRERGPGLPAGGVDGG